MFLSFFFCYEMPNIYIIFCRNAETKRKSSSTNVQLRNYDQQQKKIRQQQQQQTGISRIFCGGRAVDLITDESFLDL
jgi:hypothetical protein